ncbi:RanBPM and CLTH-like protein, putative, partial [Plasmodium malariae]
MIEDSIDENCHVKNWLKEFEYTKIHENDLNEVIMNYFCVHRMYDVAKEFQKEANVKPDMPIDTVKIRYLIQSEIMNNKIEEAIEHINNLDEGILKKHKDLVFFLKKQQLLKLILNSNINEAIMYSQQELAPYVNEKSEEAKKLIQKIEKKKNTLKRIDDIILSYYNVDNGTKGKNKLIII